MHFDSHNSHGNKRMDLYFYVFITGQTITRQQAFREKHGFRSSNLDI